MSGFWQVNGIDLKATEVRVYPVTLVASRRVRQDIADVYGGSQVRQSNGLDLPRLSIQFIFDGKGDPKFEEMTEVVDILENEDVWTLGAPTDKSVFAYLDQKRVALATLDWSFDPRKALSVISLTLNAYIDGVWIADGGDYSQALEGHFTYDGSVFVRDDGVNTGATPVLRVPEQTVGYPLARNATTFALAQPAFISSTVVDGRTYSDYDMTGFLSPTPVAGSGAGYEAYSSRSLDFLNAVP